MKAQPDLTAGLEFRFDTDDFNRLRDLITARTGIVLHDHKKVLVYSRLSRRLRTLGLKSFAEYLTLLTNGTAPANDELMNLINAMTTNVTAFFREPHHFTLLADRLPGLVERFGRLSLWSAAASTGEEPWSIAMTCAQVEERLGRTVGALSATDIDTTVLARARAAEYLLDPADVAAQLLMKKYLREGATASPDPVRPTHRLFQVADALRPRVTFSALNLIEPLPWPDGSRHVVFCRNVVIYFSKETQRKLFAEMARVIPSGGLLCIGHSESLFGVTDSFRLLGRTAYERV